MLPKTNPLDSFLAVKGVWPHEQDTPPDLFHFTGHNAANSILRDGIRCFNSNSMTDKNEFQLGRMYMMLNPCGTSEKYSWEELCADAEKDVRCWTFSLCRADDKKTWNEMLSCHACGKAGGPTILSFKFKELNSLVSNRMTIDMTAQNKSIPERSYHFFLPCLYATTQRLLILEVEKYLFGEYFEEVKSAYENEIDERTLAFACSYIFRAMVKAEQYKKEQEYRLVKITFDGSNEKSQLFGINYKPNSVPLPFDCPIFENKECPK